MNALVQDLGIGPTLAQYDVITSWPRVVGEQVARVTVAQRIDNGVLYVGVSSAAWRAELTMKRLDIIEKLNTNAGKRVVKDIRFR
jgi:predicted nucleic acid-binding Zn ribbon protein